MLRESNSPRGAEHLSFSGRTLSKRKRRSDPTDDPGPTDCKVGVFLPRRIVSGGQTGVDRAGLDAAIALGLDHGGWCPAGRRSEDGSVPSRYNLTETTSREYPVRTEQNVLDSDATLIMYEREIKGGTLLTQRICRRLGKESLTIDIDRDPPSEVRSWLRRLRPEVLNIAGPRESSFPGISTRSFGYLMQVFSRS